MNARIKTCNAIRESLDRSNRQKQILIIPLLLCISSLSILAMENLQTLPDNFDDIRDPLLPLDYVKPSEQVVEKPDPEELRRKALLARIKWPTLELQGISHAGGKRFIAVIKDFGIVEEGEIVEIRKDDLIYVWKIDEISQKGMKTTKLRVRESLEPNQISSKKRGPEVPEILEMGIETP